VPLLQAWTGDLLVEALWWRLGVPVLNSPDPQAKLQHIWGTPAYLGVILLEAKKPNTYKGIMDCIRFEWSDDLAKFVEQSVKCMMDYQALIPAKPTLRTSVVAVPLGDSPFEEVTFTASINNVNIFLIVNDEKCNEKSPSIMLRLDSSRIEKSKNKLSLSFDDAKMLTLDKGHYYNCIKADDVRKAWGFVKAMKLSMKQASSEIGVQSGEEIYLNWSTELHLQMLGLFEDMKGFLRSMKYTLQPSQQLLPIPAEVKASPSKKMIIRMRGEMSLGIKISSRHNLRISTEDFVMSLAGEEISALTSSSRIAIDGVDTFFIDGLAINMLQDSEEIRVERAGLENFVLPWNRTWSIVMKALLIRFPHEHYYSEAIQNEFVSLFKWLKMVHKYQKKPFTSESPLPADLLIRIQEFAFEMSDDPFEVKLRDNYELLEDEFREAETRKKMLTAKIEELQKTHLHFPSGKFEELYKGLSKKNAEIYIQRSKQMNQGPQRTRLFAWTMQDLEILALADPSIHGTENAVSVLNEIDSESPWPLTGLNFTTLWCRAIRLNCKEWKFLLRDFPQPLLHIRSMLVWGRLVGAEQEATKRAKRTCLVEIADSWPSEVIERSMTSLKFYHDFSCDVEHFSYAFGPCWEPVIAQCNLSFERISSPSRDPSPPLPFWDKIRLLFHGRLTMSMQTMAVLLHASLDPYNTTEEMELTWSEVVMDWTNAKFVFKGDLNIYVKTASKYDDCRLLHLPNLKLTLKLHWVCLADPNDHHSVMPCAPDKLPEYSSNQEHDSFRAFR
jgi:RNA pol II promoter Fmp27 protein domain